MTFDDWWDNWGSGITPRRHADMESHARRVAREAWDASLRDGLQHERQAYEAARFRYETMLKALVEAAALLKPAPILVSREDAESAGLIPAGEPVQPLTPSSTSTAGSAGADLAQSAMGDRGS